MHFKSKEGGDLQNSFITLIHETLTSPSIITQKIPRRMSEMSITTKEFINSRLRFHFHPFNFFARVRSEYCNVAFKSA